MATLSSDAFVFFGATGDLAYKKIVPALQAMVRRGELDMPIIGVARPPWALDKRANACATASSIAAASMQTLSGGCARSSATSMATTTAPGRTTG
jgi:glucose-6-phosphate 1-dehydrogenase